MLEALGNKVTPDGDFSPVFMPLLLHIEGDSRDN